jgi:glucosamine--fructose-6-phosphate aminotransferase (isomerizing)
MGLRDEILDQPAAVARLLDGQADVVAELARRVRVRGPGLVYIAARGSSDNAGLYAKYLWGAHNRLPVALATPSLFSVYASPPVVRDALVVGISQSGQSPDIVSVIQEGRRQGALTLAITNDPSSPLAAEAELVIDTMAGPELAIAATKTYTTQLVAIAMVSAALSGDAEQQAWLARARPDRGGAALEDTVAAAAARYRYMSQGVVLGRGYNYATAFEWALKLKELAYVAAEPYSSADFQHGPVALASRGFPVFAVVVAGRMANSIRPLLARLVDEQAVELLAISNDAIARLAHAARAAGRASRVDLADPGDHPGAAALLPPDAGQGLRHRRPARADQGHPHLVRRPPGRDGGTTMTRHRNLLALIPAAVAAALALAAAPDGSTEDALPVRGFCIAAPLPDGVDAFINFIEQELVTASINTLVLRVDYNFEYRSHPELRDDVALSEKQVKKIVKACRRGGIRVIPQINLLGHQSWEEELSGLLRVYPELDETPHIAMPQDCCGRTRRGCTARATAPSTRRSTRWCSR